MLSQAVGDYLKTIYKLQGDGVVSTTDIARALDVSSASVTNMEGVLRFMIRRDFCCDST